MNDLTVEQWAAVMSAVVFETVIALSPDRLQAVGKMEEIANQLHEAVSAIPDSQPRRALAAITSCLMRIERGSNLP